jgi:tRNA(fMet)-specific endonuclease VapC
VNYALDTNVVIDILRYRRPTVRERFRRALAERASITLSSVVLFELWYGVARAQNRRDNAERLRVFLSGDIQVAPFTEDDALTAGDLRAALAAAGAPIGPYDVLVAAQAFRSGATLVTANTREFARVEGLAWEDWTLET